MVVAKGAMFANRDLRLPVILDLHENRPEIMRFYPHLNKFPGNALISVEKWKRKEEELVQKADRVIVVTDEAAKDLAQRTQIDPNRLAVVPNTVKRSFFENFHTDEALINRYNGKFVLLYLGDTGLRRGLITVLKSLNDLKKKIVDPDTGKTILKLLIVGSSSSDPILKKEVADSGLEELVDFEGWQAVDRFPSYILASDVGLCPLHRNQHHDSTFANKIFQYMSFSKPILVSDSTAQKNLVHKANCGLVHEAENSSDFSLGVVKLFEDQDLAEKLGKNGKSFLEERFVWEKVKNELIDLYSNLQLV
jgi:glycosyltransferase involved in cell wall biosynthesis